MSPAPIDAFGGRAVRIDPGDDGAIHVGPAKNRGEFLRQILQTQADPVRRGVVWIPQHADDEAHVVGRQREPQPDRTELAVVRQQIGVHADHLARAIEQWPAGIAGIDRGVGLDVVVERRAHEVTVLSADHAGSHRGADAQRIADGNHPLADLQGIAVAERHRRQRDGQVHLEHRKIDPVRPPRYNWARTSEPVLEGHPDDRGILDDVLVGDDESARVDDEAGADEDSKVHGRRLAGLGLVAVQDPNDGDVDDRGQRIGRRHPERRMYPPAEQRVPPDRGMPRTGRRTSRRAMRGPRRCSGSWPCGGSGRLRGGPFCVERSSAWAPLYDWTPRSWRQRHATASDPSGLANAARRPLLRPTG